MSLDLSNLGASGGANAWVIADCLTLFDRPLLISDFVDAQPKSASFATTSPRCGPVLGRDRKILAGLMSGLGLANVTRLNVLLSSFTSMKNRIPLRYFFGISGIWAEVAVLER